MSFLRNFIFIPEATREVKYYRDQFNKNPYAENPISTVSAVTNNPYAYVVQRKDQRVALEESEYLKLVEYGYETLNPNFFIHFTNHEGELVPFTGSRWNTPYGIYGYPINGKEVAYQAMQGVESGDDEGLPYGRHFKYVVFFKLKEYDKLLVMDSYTEEQYQQDKQKLLSIYGNNVDLYNAFAFIEADQENNESQSYDDVGGGQTIVNPAQKLLFGLNNFLKQKHSEKYQEKISQRRVNKNQNFTNLNSHVIELSSLLTKLGYVGLCDLGNRFIGREYSQAVIFSSKFIQIIKQMKNPTAKSDQHINDRNSAKVRKLVLNTEKLKQKLIKQKINPAMFPGQQTTESSFELIDVKSYTTVEDYTFYSLVLVFRQKPEAKDDDVDVRLVEGAVERNLRARKLVFDSVKSYLKFIKNKEISGISFENKILTIKINIYKN